jgi:hypothetical protein
LEAKIDKIEGLESCVSTPDQTKLGEMLKVMKSKGGSCLSLEQMVDRFVLEVMETHPNVDKNSLCEMISKSFQESKRLKLDDENDSDDVEENMGIIFDEAMDMMVRSSYAQSQAQMQNHPNQQAQMQAPDRQQVKPYPQTQQQYLPPQQQALMQAPDPQQYIQPNQLPPQQQAQMQAPDPQQYIQPKQLPPQQQAQMQAPDPQQVKQYPQPQQEYLPLQQQYQYPPPHSTQAQFAPHHQSLQVRPHSQYHPAQTQVHQHHPQSQQTKDTSLTTNSRPHQTTDTSLLEQFSPTTAADGPNVVPQSDRQENEDSDQQEDEDDERTRKNPNDGVIKKVVSHGFYQDNVCLYFMCDWEGNDPDTGKPWPPSQSTFIEVAKVEDKFDEYFNGLTNEEKEEINECMKDPKKYRRKLRTQQKKSVRYLVIIYPFVTLSSSQSHLCSLKHPD